MRWRSGSACNLRNETILRMFSPMDIGERVGIGFDTLWEATYSLDKPDLVLEEFFEPDCVQLSCSWRRAGWSPSAFLAWAGEGTPLISDIEPLASQQDGQAGDQVDVVNGRANHVVNVVNAGANGANRANAVANGASLGKEEHHVLELIRANPRANAWTCARSLV